VQITRTIPAEKSATERGAAGREHDVLAFEKVAQPLDWHQQRLRSTAGSGRQRHHADERSCGVERRGAGKTRHRRRLERPFVVRRSHSQAGGRGRHGGAARLQLRIGHPHQRHIVGRRIRRRHRHRVERARAVKTQQSKIRVFGLPIGIAQSGDGDHLTSLHRRAVGDDAAGGVDDNAGRVCDAPVRVGTCQRAGWKRRKRARHRGDKAAKRALGRQIVANDVAAHLPVLDRGAHGEFLHPALLSGHQEKIRPQHRALDAARRVLAVLIKHRRKGRARRINAKGLDLQLAVRRSKAGGVGALRGARHELGGHAEPHPCCRIVEKAPADRLPGGSRRSRELLLLLRVEHPGWLAAVALLKRPDSRNGIRRHIAIGGALIVARPNQIGLDGDPLGERERRVELGRPGRRRRWRAGGGGGRRGQRDDERQRDAPRPRLADTRAAHVFRPEGGRNRAGTDIG
jgi:hypothetical protein